MNDFQMNDFENHQIKTRFYSELVLLTLNRYVWEVGCFKCSSFVKHKLTIDVARKSLRHDHTHIFNSLIEDFKHRFSDNCTECYNIHSVGFILNE